MATNSNLNEKELQVLTQISRNSSISQRELARATGISLGLVNILLKKFLKVGYVKISRLNKKKLEYALTRQSFLALTRKTYQYATRTIRDYHRINEQLSELLDNLISEGYRYISVYGDGELREMIESLAGRLSKDMKFELGLTPRESTDAIVLNVMAEPMPQSFQYKYVNVLDQLEQ